METCRKSGSLAPSPPLGNLSANSMLGVSDWRGYRDVFRALPANQETVLGVTVPSHSNDFLRARQTCVKFQIVLVCNTRFTEHVWCVGIDDTALPSAPVGSVGPGQINRAQNWTGTQNNYVFEPDLMWEYPKTKKTNLKKHFLF